MTAVKLPAAVRCSIGRHVVIGCSMPPRPADPADPATAAQAGPHQQLRAHLAVLKLHHAAEHLPAVLDQATAQNRLVALHGRPPPGSCLRPKVHHAVDRTLTNRQIKSGRRSGN